MDQQQALQQQQAAARAAAAAAAVVPPQQPRPLVQQSNQVVKRLALLGVQQKQLENPELRREVVKEPSITFLAFIVDRLLDHLLTSMCHAQSLIGPDQLDVETLVRTVCSVAENSLADSPEELEAALATHIIDGFQKTDGDKMADKMPPQSPSQMPSQSPLQMAEKMAGG